MTEISAAAVKSLRDKTGLPIMKCKEALQATAGDEQAAIEFLRKDNIVARCTETTTRRGGSTTALSVGCAELAKPAGK